MNIPLWYNNPKNTNSQLTKELEKILSHGKFVFQIKPNLNNYIRLTVSKYLKTVKPWDNLYFSAYIDNNNINIIINTTETPNSKKGRVDEKKRIVIPSKIKKVIDEKNISELYISTDKIWSVIFITSEKPEIVMVWL